MTKFLLALVCVCLSISTIDAQSFYKKQRKFKRRYISVAITGSVARPERPSALDVHQSLTSNMGSLDESTYVSSRQIRRERRRADRSRARAERIAARSQEIKYRDERATLGNHMVAYRQGQDAYFGR